MHNRTSVAIERSIEGLTRSASFTSSDVALCAIQLRRDAKNWILAGLSPVQTRRAGRFLEEMITVLEAQARLTI